jgi:hypothetical protein
LLWMKHWSYVSNYKHRDGAQLRCNIQA